jgi:hypothetical protein
MQREFGEEVGALDVVFQLANGSRSQVRLRIGRPCLVRDGEWACPVELRGFERRLPDAVGADSLQSLCLARSLLRDRLSTFMRSGGTVIDPVDGTVWDESRLKIILGR